MKFKRIQTPGIAHYAYILVDGEEAAIVDPRRDVDDYLDAVQAMGAHLRYIIETHRHEDYVIGSAHLAARTGAEVVNGTHECFGRGDHRLSTGESVELGATRIVALHTPGHTPESMCYAVYTDGREQAWGVFTGDTLFYGDTGRTDLPDADRAVENAGLLYDSVHEQLADLGDGALVLPAHGPGSVCGSGMTELPYSTLGAEKNSNPVFTCSRETFAKQKGSERLPRPPYFRHMEKVNLNGGLAPTVKPCDVPLVGPEGFAERARRGVVIDTRQPEAFAGGHIEDAHAVWLGGVTAFGGWIADHETPICLVCDRDDDVATAALHLTRIGLDEICAGLAGGFESWRSSGRPIHRAGVITPAELAATRDKYQVLDVREPDEFASGHIPGARQAYVGDLEARIDDLDLDPRRPVVVTCGVGHRAGLGVSMLLRKGFHDVRNLLGGVTAWNALDLQTEEGDN